jgi:hypothetical protein
MRSVPSSSWCTSEPYMCYEKYKFKIIIIYQYIPERLSRLKLETNNIIFPSTSTFPKWYHPFSFCDQNAAHSSHLATCAKCTAHFILMH